MDPSDLLILTDLTLKYLAQDSDVMDSGLSPCPFPLGSP